MVVIVVGWSVGVEPTLHPLCPIFGFVFRGVFAFPQSIGQRSLVGLGETLVEGRVDVEDAVEVDRMCELVDQDVFGTVRVAGVTE